MRIKRKETSPEILLDPEKADPDQKKQSGGFEV